MMTTTMTSTATVSTSPAAFSAGSQAPTSDSLNADHLAPTSLAELNSAAGLLTRVDRKYLVPLERAQELVGGLISEARVLDIDGRRRFSYASTYFDTPGLEAFMLTARKRRRRFKVRTRTYLDSGLCFLEVKTRGARGSTVKRRMGYHADDASRLTGPGRAFVAACLEVGADFSVSWESLRLDSPPTAPVDLPDPLETAHEAAESLTGRVLGLRPEEMHRIDLVGRGGLGAPG